MPQPETVGVVLRAERVTKRYGQVLALDAVSIDLQRAECVALIGESGSGKTTLLRCFNRLVDPDHGRVLVDGVDAARLDPIALRRRIGYVPRMGGFCRTGEFTATSDWSPGCAECPSAMI